MHWGLCPCRRTASKRNQIPLLGLPLLLLRYAVPGANLRFLRTANLRFLRAATKPLPSTGRALLLPSTLVAHFLPACSALEGAVLLELLQGRVPIAVRSRAEV